MAPASLTVSPLNLILFSTLVEGIVPSLEVGDAGGGT